ncbi:hypothetical protein B0T25DRAFT_348247 [Lasiosphaeria hispida]|uniref:dihydroneopterin aldolase n=1 Tax=Lasiosphaeria hispida TaxID=260671 RepID=A0AAJ0H6M6_9PEZI|nr:hypothetical protein B0T25DRAFT_348247 [Lasiosphaeria hispida]
MSGLSSTLSSTWAVQAKAGEPVAVVSVRNLQSIIYAGLDAWGRPHKGQPILISAAISFAQPFDAAAANDCLGADTVHYGSLSKAILEGIREWTIPVQGDYKPTAAEVLDDIWYHLTGKQTEASGGVLAGRIKEHRAPFLSAETKEGIRSLSVTITLPKASLLGSGVSLTATSVFGEPAPLSAVALLLDSLRVPTLVGVNSNERLAKQIVAVSITIEKLGWTSKDFYTELETLVVQTLEESEFETLEALGTHIADTIAVIYSCDSKTEPRGGQPWGRFWDIHVRMEKPTAVPLADCPIVEVRRMSNNS